MTTTLAALRDWAERRATVLAERGPLIQAAIRDGRTDTEIHQACGVSRTTIGQIRNPHGPLATREAARRALHTKGVTMPDIWTTKDGRVLLSLPHEDPDLPAPHPDEDPAWFEAEVAGPMRRRNEHDAWTGRMNWAGAIIDTLRPAGIAITRSDEPEGADLREHLAHRNEQHAVLTLKENQS